MNLELGQTELFLLDWHKNANRDLAVGDKWSWDGKDQNQDGYRPPSAIHNRFQAFIFSNHSLIPSSGARHLCPLTSQKLVGKPQAP